MNTQSGGRQVLVHGAILVLAGLTWGLAVPATPHPRLALGAHIQFVLNGMLFVILATALQVVPHSAGIKSIRVMVLAAWLTWTMVLSEVANAWWGTAQTLPLAASQAGVSGAESWQELIVRATHIGAGLALIVAWSMFVLAILNRAPSAGSSAGITR